MIGQFFSDAKRVIIKNVSGEEIPARSFVKVTGGEKLTSGQECLHGSKPDGDGSVYVVSGLAVIPAGGIGYGFWPSSPVWTKFSSQPVPVEEVGPESGNWECDPDGSGFDCLRIKDGLALVIKRGSSSGVAPVIMFRIVASYFCGECYVDARVIGVLNGLSVSDLPDVDEYDNNAVRIFDKMGCVFDEPPDDLVNRIGLAIYMNCLEDGPCPNTTGPRWVAMSLCCSENGCV